MEKRVVIAGGSGFLGQNLTDLLLSKGYSVVILTRKPSEVKGNVRYVQWDGKHLNGWAKEIDGSDAVVNFTGKSVNCIYTKQNREEIISSRVNSVRVLKEAVNKSKKPPRVFVQAGSLAIFGNTREKCDENAPHGMDFSANVCRQWETEFFKETFQNTRQVQFRIGLVLGKDGGVLEPFKMLTKYHLGGTIGSGKQVMSWIHIDDLLQMFMDAIESEQMEGLYNATGPNPVTNKEFMKTMRKVLNKGWAPSAPTPFVWLGAYLFMRTDPSLALGSQNGIPKRLLESGFQFKYPNLELAIKDLV